MHAKSGQIRAFIENDLAREIDQAFAAGGNDQVAKLKARHAQARGEAQAFGIDAPDAKVKEERQRRGGGPHSGFDFEPYEADALKVALQLTR